MTTQQQRVGAQRAAADRVRQQQGVFRRDLSTLLGEAEGLRPHYRGPAASSFFALVGQWLSDAESIVADMEGFASKLDRQETEVNVQQDDQASSFSRAATRLSTRA